MPNGRGALLKWNGCCVGHEIAQRPLEAGQVVLEDLPVHEDALVVPSIAVLQSLDAVSVFTVEDGIAVRRTVETGERDQRNVEILRGLQPGMEVITSGIQSVREGQPVQVVGQGSIG